MFKGTQKAVAAFVVSLLTSATTSLLTGLQALGDGASLADLDQAAWLTVVLAVLGATGLTTGTVYAVSNDEGDGPGV